MVDGADETEAGDVVAVNPAHDHDDQALKQGNSPAHAVDPILVSGNEMRTAGLLKSGRHLTIRSEKMGPC